MLTYIHLPANSNQPVELARCDDSLEGVQHVLGDSYEPIPVDSLDHLIDDDDSDDTFHLFIDANSKAKDLPVNSLATRLGRLYPGDYIAGDAMLVRTDRCSDWVALSPALWEVTLEHLRALNG